MYIIKRDGSKEIANPQKIKNAVKAAFSSVDYKVDEDVIDKIVSDVKLWDGINIEDIQDEVIEVLRDYDYDEVANSYLTYRQAHAAIRRHNKWYNDTLEEKFSASKVKNQNANVDEKSFGGRKGEAESFVAKQYALDYCMSKKARDEHENNEVYIHDLDSYAIGEHNCLTVPIDNLFANGFKTRQSNIRPVGSINTAFQLLAVIFQLQSLQQFGGVSASHLDWSMVPYVRKSFFKHFVAKYINKRFKEDGIDALKLSSLELKKLKNTYTKEFRNKYNILDEDFGYGNFHIKVVNFHIGDIKIKSINEDWYNEALLETIEELNQAVEGMYHNLNTLQSRSGN